MGSLEKLQTGTVVSNKMDKTVVVKIDRYKRHRLYKKTIRVTQRYKAHDERNECSLGDIVKIAETRPLSREKRWRVVEIVRRGDVAEVAPRDLGATQIAETLAASAPEAPAAARAASDREANDEAETETIVEAAAQGEEPAEGAAAEEEA